MDPQINYWVASTRALSPNAHVQTCICVERNGSLRQIAAAQNPRWVWRNALTAPLKAGIQTRVRQIPTVYQLLLTTVPRWYRVRIEWYLLLTFYDPLSTTVKAYAYKWPCLSSTFDLLLRRFPPQLTPTSVDFLSPRIGGPYWFCTCKFV